MSPADAALLGTVFQIADPSRLRDLRTDIPDSSVVEIDKVEGGYEVLAGRAERHRWIRCCECGTDRNHKRGFVLRFADGTRPTVGRDCARDEHSPDFDAYLEAFQGKRDRAHRLPQFAAAVAVAPDHLGDGAPQPFPPPGQPSANSVASAGVLFRSEGEC